LRDRKGTVSGRKQNGVKVGRGKAGEKKVADLNKEDIKISYQNKKKRKEGRARGIGSLGLGLRRIFVLSSYFSSISNKSSREESTNYSDCPQKTQGGTRQLRSNTFERRGLEKKKREGSQFKNRRTSNVGCLSHEEKRGEKTLPSEDEA